MPGKWFKNWFNSPFYHILYHNRNDEEAEFFIDNLCRHLDPPAGARVLDIACGRGRHAVFMNKKGYDVTGIDLSASNIRFARKFQNRKLHFFVHDMRLPFYINYFDIAFNLFTSFGYFDSKKDHVNALRTFRRSLAPGGLLVLDYFNSAGIIRNLKEKEVKHAGDIDFNIEKEIVGDKIIKSISFEHKNTLHTFREEVKAFTLDDFRELFQLSGFTVLKHFGNYALEDFNIETSDRLIFICQKGHD